MRKKVGLCCMVLGILLVVAAGGLFLYNHAEASKAAKASEDIMPKLAEQIPLQPMEPISSEQPKETTDTPSDRMPTVEIDGYEYIGYLYIPTLELELPVMDEWDYARLKISPCRYYGSVYTDDFVIAGHNYSRHFGKLSTLSIGDTVWFTAMDGTVYIYRVGEIETLSPAATEKMIVSDWDLSLYTCTPGGAKRVTIRCEKVDK